jgi:putative ABC transport system permease protein
MFRNYIKASLRNLKAYKGYSLINIAGLAIGIACFLLIFIYVSDEFSYGRFHRNGEQIYRVTYEINNQGKATLTAQTPAPLGPALLKEYPEVKNYVRLNRFEVNVKYQGDTYSENFLFADESLFDVFTFPLLKGDPRTALKEPDSIVLTEEMAEKYFGRDDPMGKILTVNENQDFKVQGVLKNIPRNSHFHFDFLVPFSTQFQGNKARMEYWGNIFYYNYLLFDKGFSPTDFEKKLPEFVKKYIGGNFRSLFGDNLDQVPSLYKFHLQPMTKIHLYSHLEDEMEPNSSISYIYIFSTVAFFILFIACINFMNLSTARSSSRAKEVGVRKVVGAERRELIHQFLGESFFLAFISLFVATGLIELFLPVFNSLSGKSLSIHYLANWTILTALFGVFVFVGICSGSYPAFLLSSFRPVDVLKGKIRPELSASLIRKSLVIFQFAISIILVAGTFVIHDQMTFMQTKDLGFDKEHIVLVKDQNRRVIARYDSFKNELLKDPGISAVSASSGLPVNIFGKSTVRPEDAEFNESVLMPVIAVNYDFIDTYGIEVISGRKFSTEFETDKKEAFMINEAARERFGWKEAIGQKLEDIGNRKGTVIGVVKDFHLSSLHQRIEPLALYLQPFACRYFSIKIRPQNIPKTLAFIGEVWKRFNPSRPFSYSFLEDDLNRFYRAEQKLGQIFSSFAILTIFIACLGLFGLSSFTAEQRTKEIGIRKVCGASVSNIIFMLNKEFTKWVLLASIIACPFAYYALSRWLQNFAYRISLNVGIFLLSALAALVIALATVSYQSLKAALANPVEVLRYE